MWLRKANVYLENWVNVPTNSILTIHRQTVMVHPIMDKYYAKSPYHIRSSAFVQTKGLLSNEKAEARILSPMPSLGQTLPFGVSLSRNRTPDQVTTVSSVTPSDLKSPLPLIPSRDMPTNPPSQGNIKRKRRSLNALELAESRLIDADLVPPAASGRSEYGNPNKIAQYFPELRLP